MESWRLIRSGPLPGGLNMAIDEVLLGEVASGRSAPVLRLYRWDPPTLTLGYAQKVAGRVDLCACRELGIEVVRRPTGGRAVLHDREATYAVVSPERTEVFPGGILGNYRVIAGALQALLHSFGLEAHFAPVRAVGGDAGANCFAAPAACELLFRGCKMTGSAQRRSGGAFLQHGSIPVEMDLMRLNRLLQCGDAPLQSGAVERLSEKVGWLNRWLHSPVDVDQVERGLAAAFAGRFGISLVEGSLTPAEHFRAQALCLEKYTDLAG